MTFTSLEKVGTAKYWLGNRGLILETWIEDDIRVCIEEALMFLALFFVWNESMKVLYYQWRKYLNWRRVVFIVKGNPGILKQGLTVTAQAGKINSGEIHLL